jgi:hypothetical protein
VADWNGRSPTNWTAKVEYLFVDLIGNISCNHGYNCGGYDAAATTTIRAPTANSSVQTQ